MMNITQFCGKAFAMLKSGGDADSWSAPVHR
jgi:hypothetical protein